jgi:class 3 adenylate cyclase
MRLWKAEATGGQGRHLRHGVGFASGTPVSGHIGSLRKRLDATVIGDTVNLAARLEKLAGRDGAPSILTTSQTIAGLAGEFVSISTSLHGVRGRREAIEIVGIGETNHD